MAQKVQAALLLAALLALAAAGAAQAECLAMCKPCEKSSDCCQVDGASCGCAKNPVPDGPQLVCMCSGSSFSSCVKQNVATTLAAKRASLGNATTKAAPIKTKCVVMPPGKARRVACVETAPAAINGTNVTTAAVNATATAAAAATSTAPATTQPAATAAAAAARP